jgi:HEAT repeat protein
VEEIKMGIMNFFKPKWKHKYKHIRIAAIEKLTDQKIIGDVAKNDVHADVRIAAVEKLTDQKTLENIAKNDVWGFVRYAAAKRMTDQKPLEDIAKNYWDKDVREAAVFSLGYLGNSSAIDKLKSIIKDDEDKFKRQRAIDAIINITDERVTDFFIQYIQNEEYVGMKVFEYLVKTKSVKSIKQIILLLNSYSNADQATETLIQFGENALEPLIEVISNKKTDFHIRAKSIKILGEIGDNRVVDILINNCKDFEDNPHMVTVTMEALEKIGDEKAVDYAISLLQKVFADKYFHKDFCMSGLKILEKFPSVKVFEILIKLLEWGNYLIAQDYEIIQYAAKILKKSKSDEAKKALDKFEKTEGTKKELREINKLISKLIDYYNLDSKYGAFEKAIGEREIALRTLINYGKLAVMPLLEELDKFNSIASRTIAARALGEIGDKKTKQALTLALEQSHNNSQRNYEDGYEDNEYMARMAIEEALKKFS